MSLSWRHTSRRTFLPTAGAAVGAGLLASKTARALASPIARAGPDSTAADYVLHIVASPIEITPKHIVPTTTHNGKFPGPLLRFKEGQPVTVEIHNDTDTPEQLHWHGQKVSTDVDGAAEEGTPYIPAHGQRRITFTPNPAGLRFYHTHNHGGADVHAGQYSGQVGPVYIEPKENPGRYDREIFLTLKEFEPALSRGGDMPQDFLSPSLVDQSLRQSGEAAMKASLAKAM